MCFTRHGHPESKADRQNLLIDSFWRSVWCFPSCYRPPRSRGDPLRNREFIGRRGLNQRRRRRIRHPEAEKVQWIFTAHELNRRVYCQHAVWYQIVEDDPFFNAVWSIVADCRHFRDYHESEELFPSRRKTIEHWAIYALFSWLWRRQV